MINQFIKGKVYVFERLVEARLQYEYQGKL